jgi:hypothetical protein
MVSRSGDEGDVHMRTLTETRVPAPPYQPIVNDPCGEWDYARAIKSLEANFKAYIVTCRQERTQQITDAYNWLRSRKGLQYFLDHEEKSVKPGAIDQRVLANELVLAKLEVNSLLKQKVEWERRIEAKQLEWEGHLNEERQKRADVERDCQWARDRIDALEAEVESLQAEVQTLKSRLTRSCSQLTDHKVCTGGTAMPRIGMGRRHGTVEPASSVGKDCAMASARVSQA